MIDAFIIVSHLLLILPILYPDTNYLYVHKCRIFWSATISMATTASIILLCIALKQGHRDEINLVTDSINIPIWFYPFPAVTICDFNQISKEKLSIKLKDIKTHQNVTKEDLSKLFKSLINIHPFYNGHYSIDDLNLLQEVLEYNNMTAEDIIQLLAPSCSRFLYKCFWKLEEKSCQLLFKPVMTAFGLCCSFNMFAFKHQETNVISFESKPKRVSSCGGRSGLFFLIRNEIDDYFSTLIPSYGHMVLVHNPYEMPSKDVLTVLQSSASAKLLSITPILTTMDREIGNAIKNIRNCSFKDERQMKMFNMYTFRNCIYECEIQKIIDNCLCVPFHIKHTSDTFSAIRVCNLRDVPCVKTSYYRTNCSCQGNCEYYKYTFSYSSGTFSGKYFDYRDLNNRNEAHSVLDISFTDLSATRNKYIFSFTWNAVLSLSGGVLSLFTGFSFKAILEIVYFIIVHIGKKYFFKQQNNYIPKPIDYRN